MKQSDLLLFDSKGIYCPQARIYIDPWKPVDRAIITHGHSDHARFGHQKYLTHHTNVPIIRHRLGPINVQGLEWNEPFRINGVTFSLHPAGHIIGSSQVRVAYKGEVWVFTGDYKTEDDGVSTPYAHLVFLPLSGKIRDLSSKKSMPGGKAISMKAKPRSCLDTLWAKLSGFLSTSIPRLGRSTPMER